LYLASVTAEGTKEAAITVHDDETEPLIGLQELAEGLHKETGSAQIRGHATSEEVEVEKRTST